MNSYAKLTLAAIFAAASLTPAFAQHASHSAAGADAHAAASAQAAGEARMTEGEIRKVDKEAGKMTIKHGELKSLGMPAMTMVFRAKEPAMLDQVKMGDKISFVADKIGGQLTVTQVQVKN
jgi:Cu/Ag efflux protein CusF